MQQRAYLTTKQLAELLNISLSGITRLAHTGKLMPHIRVGKKIMFSAKLVDEWLEKQETIPDAGR